MNGDGRPEIVLGGGEEIETSRERLSILAVWNQTGQLLPGWPYRLPYPEQGGFWRGYGTAAIADVDGDGLNDIIADRTTAFDRPLTVDAFNGRGERLADFSKPSSGHSAWRTNTPAVADFDGDGRHELAYINNRGDIFLWDLPAPVTDPTIGWPMIRHNQHQTANPHLDTGGPCIAGPQTLCLADGRFRVKARWRDFIDERGLAMARPLTDDTGAFWFFDDANLELIVKVLDGRADNGHFWVFYGSLSNVEFALDITDTQSGARRSYVNQLGAFASLGDITAFAGLAPAAPRRQAPKPPSAKVADHHQTTGCTPSSTSLCLNQGRFEVSITWRDFLGNSDVGQTFPLSGDTGSFWFFHPENLEVVVKVLDGRTFNGHFWVFYGALSNVEYQIQVRDTETGAVKEYFNPLGTFGSFGDTQAF